MEVKSTISSSFKTLSMSSLATSSLLKVVKPSPPIPWAKLILSLSIFKVSSVADFLTHSDQTAFRKTFKVYVIPLIANAV